MFPAALLPVGAIFLGMAILSEMAQSRTPARRYRSVEACVADLNAMWVKEDGVLRVYHEANNVTCGRIVVECQRPPRAQIPGNVDGYPVLIRMAPSAQRGRYGAIDAYAPAEQQAADKLLRRMQAMGRTAVPWSNGELVKEAGPGRARIQVTAPDPTRAPGQGLGLSEVESTYLGYLQNRYDLDKVSSRLEQAPIGRDGTMVGPDLLQITFEA